LRWTVREAASVDPEAAGLESRIMRVLLVEDNPADARVIGLLLEESTAAAIELVRVQRISEALDLLEAEHVDVVLLDLGLPDSQGLDTLTALHRQAPTAPVVVVSGLDDVTVCLRALREGAQDYLLKGQLEGMLLLRSLHSAIERKHVEEQLKEYSEKLEQMVDERTRDLKEAQEQLLRREKLALLGQLAGSMGHELRNPLGAIKNAAYLLNMVLEKPDPEVKESLDIIDREVVRANRIITSLLDFARTRTPVLRKTDVNELLRTVIEKAAVPRFVELRSELAESPPPIMADRDQLGQVFGNLVLNALQAMPNGGLLTVRSWEDIGPGTAVGSSAAGARQGTSAGSGWVGVSIEDTGVGIAGEDVTRVFEPLFTTRAKGIGLGLPLARTLVEAHGGRIELSSQPAGGSRFTVLLPLSGKEGGYGAG